MLGHPIGFVLDLEMVRVKSACENVHKQQAVVNQPLADALKELFIVFAVLQHFYRHDSIHFHRKFKSCDVGRVHGQAVGPAPCCSPLLNEGFLRCRVGQAVNAGAGISLEQPPRRKEDNSKTQGQVQHKPQTYNVSDPHPQPKSKMLMPSSKRAFFAYETKVASLGRKKEE